MRIKRALLTGLLLFACSTLAHGFNVDVVGSLDYQLVSFPQLTESLISPLNEAISLLNASLPPGTGTLSSLAPLSGALGQGLGARLWFSNLWGVELYFLHTSANTSASSTLNVDLDPGGSFKLDVSYKLAVSGIGGGVGALLQASFGPIVGTLEVSALYLLGRLEASSNMRAHDFAVGGVEPPSYLSGSFNTAYKTTGFGYEARVWGEYTLGQFDIGFFLGYRNVPFTFADLDGDGTGEHANLTGFMVGGEIAIGL